MNKLEKISKFRKFISGAGFTLIELLVVIAIIGVLASVVLVSLNTSKLKSRDAKRLSDMQQIRSGLDIYYNLGNGYPSTANWNTAQNGKTQLLCGVGVPTFKVPQDPMNATMSGSGFAYTYTAGGNQTTGCGSDAVYTTYKVQFKTEGTTSIGPATTYYLSPIGISTTAPF